MPPGKLPTAEAIQEAVRQIMENDALADGGYRLMTRHEFLQGLFQERMPHGAHVEFAIPGPDEFSLDLEPTPSS